jgi:hypothetical protein
LNMFFLVPDKAMGPMPEGGWPLRLDAFRPADSGPEAIGPPEYVWPQNGIQPNLGRMSVLEKI